MGEMADWHIDQEMNAHPDWSPFGSGADDDHLVTCNRCGFVGDWGRDENDNWKIFSHETNQPHDCNREQAENIFEELT